MTLYLSFVKKKKKLQLFLILERRKISNLTETKGNKIWIEKVLNLPPRKSLYQILWYAASTRWTSSFNSNLVVVVVGGGGGGGRWKWSSLMWNVKKRRGWVWYPSSGSKNGIWETSSLLKSQSLPPSFSFKENLKT